MLLQVTFDVYELVLAIRLICTCPDNRRILTAVQGLGFFSFSFFFSIRLTCPDNRRILTAVQGLGFFSFSFFFPSASPVQITVASSQPFKV
jgi:hypothetical protein